MVQTILNKSKRLTDVLTNNTKKDNTTNNNTSRHLILEAKDLYNSALEIFRYYHSTGNYVNNGFQKSIGSDFNDKL